MPDSKGSRLLLPLLAVALLAGGLAWLLWDDGTEVPAGPSGQLSADQAGDPAALERDGAPDLVGGTLASGDDRRAADTVAGLTEASPSDVPLRGLSGRVAIPEGQPVDPTLQVVALRLELSHAGFANRVASVAGTDLDLLQARFASDLARDLISESRTSVELGRAAVAEDGSFTVLVPEDADEVYLALDGRHLYVEQAVAVDLAPDATEPLLEPLRGAWVEGTLTGPSEPERALSRVLLSFGRSSMGPQAAFNTGAMGHRVRTRSGEDASFELRAIPPGSKYAITAVPTDLAALKYPVGTLDAGQHARLSIELVEGGSLAGRVLDAEGQPIGNARVWASLPGRWMGFDDRPVRQVQSGEDGAFTLPHLPPGDVTLRADHDRFLDTQQKTVTVVDGEVLDGLELTLEPGRRVAGVARLEDGSPAVGARVSANFDLAFMAGPGAMAASRGASAQTTCDDEGRFELSGLGAGPFTIRAELTDAAGEMLATARRDAVQPGSDDLSLVLYAEVGLAGVVLDEAGDPVPEFTMSVARVTEGAMMTMRLEREQGTFSSPEGRFRFTGLQEGTWEVIVRGQGVMTSERVRVDLPRGPGPDLEIQVVRTATVTGRVIDPAGEPIAEATVAPRSGQAEWQQQATADALDARTRTAEDGRFTLEVVPGAVVLEARAEGYVNSAPEEFDVAPGGTFETGDLVLRIGGSIAGEVIGEDGQPVEGWMVSASVPPSLNAYMTTTDGEGRFQLDPVPPGNYQVVTMNTEGDGFGTTEDGGIDLAGMLKDMQMAQCAVKDGEETWLTLSAEIEGAVRVFGKVTLDGEPYTDANVTFWPEGAALYQNMKLAAVDSQGNYELELGQRGDFVVFVQTMPGGVGQQNTTEYTVAVPEGVTEHELNFAVPEGRISGRVLGPDGEPAVGERVTLTRDGVVRTDTFFGGQYTEMLTDAAGEFDIPGLRPGRYRLSAGGTSLWGGSGRGLGRVTRSGLSIAEGQWRDDLELRLPTPGTLRVTVKDAAGAPVPGATVFVRDAEGQMLEPFSLLATDAVGVLEYQGISPGDYTVTARSPLLATRESVPVRVPEGDAAEIGLLAEPGSVLWVKVMDGEGRSVRGSISVVDSEGREVTGMFGMNDFQALYMEGAFDTKEYRIGPLAAGSYKVRASKDGKSASKRVRLRGEPSKRITIRIR